MKKRGEEGQLGQGEQQVVRGPGKAADMFGDCQWLGMADIW